MVDTILDPYGQWQATRGRLHVLRRTLKTYEEQQFVMDYMDENFPEEAASTQAVKDARRGSL